MPKNFQKKKAVLLNDLRLKLPIEFIEAIECGNREVIQKHIDTVEERYLPDIIFLAAITAQFALVKYLFVPISEFVRTKIDYAQLHNAAIQLGSIDLVIYLLKENDYLNCDYMKLAIKSGQLEIVKLFIMNGFNMNAQEKSFHTEILEEEIDYPLHMAARFAHPHIIKYLINQGLDFKRTNSKGYTLLHSVVKTVSYSKVDEAKTVQVKIELIKYLLSLGIEIEKNTLHKRSMLHIAVKNGQSSLVKFLINNTKLNIHDVDSYGNTLLHLAVYYQHNKPHLINYLINQSIDINAVNNKHNNVLSYAFQINPNIINDGSNPGLYYPFIAIKLLLIKGVDPSIKNNKGESFYEDFMQKVDKCIENNPLDTKKIYEVKILVMKNKDGLPCRKLDKISWKATFFNSISDSEKNEDFTPEVPKI